MYKYISSKYLNSDFITEINKLDHRNYPVEFAGDVKHIKARFEANKESYIICFDGKEIVGYICFFPISDSLATQIQNGIWADNKIEAKDILKWNQIKHEATVLAMSAVVAKKHQMRGIGSKLMSKMLEQIKSHKHANKSKWRVIGVVVSDGGRKLMKQAGGRATGVRGEGWEEWEIKI